MKISLEARSKVATFPSLFFHRGKGKKCEVKEFVWKNKNVSVKVILHKFTKIGIERFCAMLIVIVFSPVPESERIFALARNRINPFVLQHERELYLGVFSGVFSTCDMNTQKYFTP